MMVSGGTKLDMSIADLPPVWALLTRRSLYMVLGGADSNMPLAVILMHPWLRGISWAWTEFSSKET